MTREEAIEKLEQLWNEIYNEDSDGYDYAKAIDMAIEALKSDVKPVVRGENLGGGAFLCSVCGFDDVAHSHTVKFCPNCGAEIINARPADEDDSGLRK